MPAPLNPNLWPTVLHDQDAVPISSTNPLPVDVSVTVGDLEIVSVKQVQTIETTTPLAASATAAGADHDCITFESFGISVYCEPDPAAALNATVLVENSADGATWRTVDSINLSGAAGVAVQLNRVYSVCRKFYRVSVTNNDNTNAMVATEMISMLKPI